MHEARPAFTIVIPTRNQGRWIEDAVVSVLGQAGCGPVELVVCDALSDDATPEILKRHADRLTWRREPDAGQVDAINRAFAAARGEIVAWLNSDDVYLPGAFARVEAAFAADPELDFVYGDALEIDAHGVILTPNVITEACDPTRYLHSHNFICQPACFVRRRVIARAGLLRADLRWFMDYEWFARLLATGCRGRRLRRFLAANRNHPATRTNTGGIARWWESMRVVCARPGPFAVVRPSVWIYSLDWAIKALTPGGWAAPERRGYPTRVVRRTLQRVQTLIAQPRSTAEILGRYGREIAPFGPTIQHLWRHGLADVPEPVCPATIAEGLSPGRRLVRAGVGRVRARAVLTASSVRRRVIAALDALEPLVPAPRRRGDGRVRVLLIRVDRIGDFVVWLDAARALRQRFPRPGYELVLLANRVWADFAAAQDLFDEVRPIDFERLLTRIRYRLRVLLDVRAMRADIAINAHVSRRFEADDSLVRWSGAPVRIGHEGDLANISASRKATSDGWYTQLVPAEAVSCPEAESNARLVTACGGSVERQGGSVRLVTDAAPPGLADPYFVIAPGAHWDGRRWPAAHFADVGRRLTASTGWRPVLVGSADERDVARQVVDLIGDGCVNLTGCTTVGEYAGVIRGARLVIANETAAVHLAAACGVACVCVAGGGHFERFVGGQADERLGPLAPRVVHRRMHCFACNWTCVHPIYPGDPAPCVATVTVDAVWTAVAAAADALAAPGDAPVMPGDGQSRLG